ncbi:MAG: hypothetical protein H7X77_06180 [Anaerolineae bacterium]|nr:hypothetical protein [Anaerolineae bacterium]
MSDSFLTRFFHVAQKVTEADRGLAVNSTLKVLDKFNVDEKLLADQSFAGFSQIWLRRALDDGATIITNNIITDASQAPTTNTNFANLRVVVCIPLLGHGAVYLDQHIRNGIIPREVIDRLSGVVVKLLENYQADITEAEIMALYEQTP